jgi:wobble nucleotide-excising tRNase
MLLSINTQEIGRFAALKQKAPQFNRLTLIFARNGYGKSTICAVLRSASEGEPSYIHARRRLDAKSECHVRTNWKSAPDAVFTGGKWNTHPGNVLIFDQEFVLRNLHVGDSVTRENMRSLLPVVLGKKGVELSKIIIELDREQRELDAAMKGHAAKIRATCGIALTDISAFCSKEAPDDIDKRIEKAARSVELAKQTIAVKQAKTPGPIPIVDLEHFREIAARTIETISANAADMVRAHYEKHDLSPKGDHWLKYGLDRVTETCPFCDQPIAGVKLIDAYKGYFSEAFARLVADRDSAMESIKANRSTALSMFVDQNDTGFKFWNSVCELSIIPALSTQDLNAIDEGLNLLSTALDRKAANPLEVISLGQHATTIEAAFTLIRRYNAHVEKCSVLIGTARTDAASADVARANEIAQKWLALKAKQSEPLKSMVADYAAAEIRRREIDDEKKTTQTTLREFASIVIGARQSEINVLLSDFGANFTIADTKANFVGRDPNTDYAVSIGGDKVKVGVQSETEPSFKTVLSAGDKTTLALAFFISQALSDPELSSSVVVFDDPFSSQDMHRRFETTSQIREIARNACQTIVLSHDPRFLDLTERNAEASTTATFQLQCADSGQGSISVWLAADELKELYIRRSEMLREYAGRGKLLKDTTDIELVQAMRPFLEDYLRARNPGRFNNMEYLSGMADAIKQAGAADPLFESVFDLLAINEYTRPEHHGGGKAPDPDELRAHSKKIIRIIGTY